MEAFAQALAAGMKVGEAYKRAGYRPGTERALRSSSNTLKKQVWPRVEYLLNRRASNQAIATEGVIQRIGLKKQSIALELLKSATASMADYVKPGADGALVFDFSACTRDQLTAIQEMSVEEFMDGKGEDARPVRRTKIKLYNRNVNLMNLARMFGWVAERQEDVKTLEARIRNMTPEEQAAGARSMMAEMQARLAEIAAREARTGATDAVYEDVPASEAPAGLGLPK